MTFRTYFFVGVHCNSSNSIFWKGDCLVQSSNRLNYKQARRACIQDGGDLATFAEDGDLKRVSVQLNRSKNYWIGLRHNLLIWNASGKATAAKGYDMHGVWLTNYNYSLQ